ncbi:hypothetical protein AB0I28_22305 [Phytomonospora sp. NPDC050363]|uniref:hypothetical protein n=1 Tax=Phytomonospora sp. NPDC050363 TaxID=3155642 RepID=UPI0033C3EE76
MALNLPTPPRGAPDAIRAKLTEFAEGARFTTRALSQASQERLDVSTPHRIYTLGLDDIAAGHGLDQARPGGWRFLVEDDGALIASAETSEADDGTHELTQFTEGPFVAATDNAVKAIRGLPQLAVGGFELRLLRIPALYVMALWLHSPVTDLLVPLAPSPIGKEGRLVPAVEFFRALTTQNRPSARPSPSSEPHGPAVP